jgi:hypothetical protein
MAKAQKSSFKLPIKPELISQFIDLNVNAFEIKYGPGPNKVDMMFKLGGGAEVNERAECVPEGNRCDSEDLKRVQTGIWTSNFLKLLH